MHQDLTDDDLERNNWWIVMEFGADTVYRVIQGVQPEDADV